MSACLRLVVQLERITVEMHAILPLHDGNRRQNLTLPLVVETPSHRATMERQPGMICIGRIGLVRPCGLVRLQLLPNFPSVPQGAILYAARGSLLDAD